MDGWMISINKLLFVSTIAGFDKFNGRIKSAAGLSVDQVKLESGDGFPT